MYPYRFKTEKEFIEDYGEDWRYGDDSPIENGYGWNPKMDWLLGQDFPFKDDELNEFTNNPIGRCYLSEWNISWNMLTKNKPKKPSYKPRGKITRIGESTQFKNKYDVIIFKCFDKYQFQELQKKLFKMGFTWCTGHSDILYDLNDHNDEGDPIEEYPAYIFLYIHKGWFFFSGENRLNDGDLHLTIKNRFGFGDGKINLNPYTINEFDTALNNKPSYKPRGIIKRINETFNLSKNFAFYIEDDKQWEQVQNKLSELGYIWSSGYPLISPRSTYPCLILMGSNSTLTYTFQSYKSSKYYNTHNILYFNDLKHLEHILKYGTKVPSYKPKGRIKRIGESLSNKDYYYRIMTEDELFKRYNTHNWRDIIGWYSPNMDYLFGKTISWLNDEEFNTIKQLIFIPFKNDDSEGKWLIPKSIVIREDSKNIPSYKPKGKITRIMESHDKYIDVYIKGVENILELEDLLIKFGYRWGSYDDGEYIIKNRFMNRITESNEATFYIEGKEISANFIKYPRNEILFEYPTQKRYLLNYLKIKPSYKPKGRIKRIDESIKKKDSGLTIFKCLNQGEFQELQKFLFKYGFKWTDGSRLVMNDINDENDVGDEILEYPSYIFVVLDQNRFFFCSENKLFWDSLYLTIKTNFGLKMFKDKSKIDLTPHSIDDFYRIMGIKPSYKPTDRIKRIDESFDLTKDFAFYIEDDKQWEQVQNKLSELGYIWNSGAIKIQPPDTIPTFIKTGQYKTLTYSTFAHEEYKSIYNILYFNDLKYIKRILKYGEMKPSYKPTGRIKRIGESKEILDFNEIVFEVKNKYESEFLQKELFKMDYYWSSRGKINIEIDNYPSYIFINRYHKYLSFATMLGIIKYTDSKVHNIKDYLKSDCPRALPIIFNYKEVNNIDLIFKTGNTKPNYEPKKIKR